MAINKRIIRSNDEGGAGLSFNTVLYEGNGSTNGPVLNFGFQPDLVWIKQRDVVRTHRLNDSVRGDYSTLFSDTTDAESISPTDVRVNFDYTPTSARVETGSSGWNQAGGDFVAWGWKAGGAAVLNTDGTITSQVSANTEAGFSIVSWNGTGSNETIGHGLSSAPELIITKTRDSGIDNNWNTFTTIIDGSYDYLRLNTTAAKANSGLPAPTSSVFSYGTETVDIIAYAFHSVAGFSKIGTYTGVSGGVTIDVGFEPAFVMVKCYDNAEPWAIVDNKRTSPAALFPSSSDAEYTSANFSFTFTSTGFSFPDQAIADAILNQGGYNYIYMAFANQF
jgi:hypothetical protein